MKLELRIENNANNPQMKEFRLNINPKYYQTEHPKLNFDKHFRDTLFSYIEEQVKNISLKSLS